LFEWDRDGPDARCVRTWGEGNLLERRLLYLDGETRVTDSLGAVTRYTIEAGLAVAVQDPAGQLWLREYDEHSQLQAHVDPLGNRRAYAYDERGNVIEIRQGDGASIRLVWSEDDRLLRAVDACGGWWQWRYDERGRIAERLDPAGGARRFLYDDRWLIGTVDATGATTTFGWDARGNVTGIRSTSGATERWEYDVLGRPTLHVDARGQVQRRHYDLRGRMIRVDDPDGRVGEARWDGHDNLIWARVGDFEAEFEYVARGKLSCRRVGEEQLRFVYDSEERLKEVVARAGQRYRFEHDSCGQLVGETDFGGATTRYERDAAGRIVTRTSPTGLATRFVNDACDRLTEIIYADDSRARYRYRADGMMCAAVNDTIEVELERDAVGRVLVERQGEHWVSSTYDRAGRRVELRSSLGAHQVIERDASGLPSRVTVCGSQADQRDWTVEFERDLHGAELERRMPGGVISSHTYDALGRVQRHRILLAGETLRTRSYAWRPGLALAQLDDDIFGSESFGHDALGALTWAKRGEDFELRLRDLTRDVFSSQDPGTREYGACGELRRNGSERRSYDAEGRLLERRDATDRVWRYEWSAAGQLARVLRPDGRRVELGYDALGRRVAKRFDGQLTRFVWDAGVPLHEWREQLGDDIPLPARPIDARPSWSELVLGSRSTRGPPTITWLFEPGSFSPLARLDGDTRESIVCDHRGAPILAVDEHGAVTWQADLDLSGKLRLHAGAREHVPFRFAGQYEDVETGLYYNRFRYYDPEAGLYISRDAGGLLHGLSVYAYVNDPHKLVDPLGLNPTDIALGLANTPQTINIPGLPPINTMKEDALGQFAANPVGDGSVRAGTWSSFDGAKGTPVDQLGPVIRGGMDDAKTIHFNLEGMNNVADIAANPDPSRFHPPSTNWELATVLSDPDLKAKTQWYDGPGKKVPCPG
jgi:RHS repeat-associated protein